MLKLHYLSSQNYIGHGIKSTAALLSNLLTVLTHKIADLRMVIFVNYLMFMLVTIGKCELESASLEVTTLSKIKTLQ